MEDNLIKFIELIRTIEKDFEVEEIKCKNIPLWPMLRIYYYNAYLRKLSFTKYKKSIKEIIKIYLNYLLDFLFSFYNIFKKAEYIIFSNFLEKRIIDNQTVDKIFQGIDHYKTIMFEYPPMIDYKLYRRLKFPHFSMLPILIIGETLAHIMKYFIPLNRVNNLSILEGIERKLGMTIDIKIVLARYLIYKRIFSLIFKIKKPSIVFISDSYSFTHMVAVNAANTLGIPTIEFQHGLINANHVGYTHIKKIAPEFYPKFFFSFGEYFTEIIRKNFTINPDNVFSVGSYYIDFMRNYINPKVFKKIIQYKSKYKKIVIITSQKTVEDELILFIEKVASLSSDVLFIFIPRTKERDFDFKIENLITIGSLGVDIDFYQIVKFADFHSTVYSTCALEAPIFGIPNILINIRGLAKFHYYNLLCNFHSTQFVNTPEEYIKILNSWVPLSKQELSKSHEIFFASNYSRNLINALNSVYSLTEKNRNSSGKRCC